MGLNYENKFGDFGVLAGLTYSFGNLEEDNVAGDFKDHKQWSAGLNLTFAGFTVGGGYLWDNQGLDGSSEREVFAGGLAWANGPLRLGASLAMQYDDSAADNDVDRYTIGAQYVYAPGMQLRATALYYDTQTGNPNDFDDAIVAVVGTVITF